MGFKEHEILTADPSEIMWEGFTVTSPLLHTSAIRHKCSTQVACKKPIPKCRVCVRPKSRVKLAPSNSENTNNLCFPGYIGDAH